MSEPSTEIAIRPLNLDMTSFYFTSCIVTLRSWIVIVDLHLDPAPGCEFGDDNLIRNLLEQGRVGLAAKAVVVRMEVSGSNNVLQVRRL